MRVVCIALLAACGRIGFDVGGGGAAGDDGRTDVAGGDDALLVDGIPAGFCTATSPVPGGGNDLAVAKTHDGFLAIWSTAGAPSSLHADPSLTTFAANDVSVLGTPNGINAIFDVANVYLIAANDSSANPSWWSLNYDFTQQSMASGTNGQLNFKDNIASNAAHSTMVYADASASTINMRYFLGNGFGTASTYAAAANVLAVAGADGPTHGHLAWTTSTGATNHVCWTGHINFGGSPMMMNVTQEQAVCGSQLRAASGPTADDATAIAWTDRIGAVHARYQTTQWDLGAGIGIRIKYDGTQFWVAWRAQTGVVHLAKLATDGTYTDYPLPALAPISIEAMELAQSASTIYVVTLEASQLVFVWAC